MIQPSELRVGNKVFFDKEKNLYYTISMSDFSSLNVFDKIEPIPLTEEILQKCGFDKDIRDSGFNEYDEVVYFFDGIDIYDKTESDSGFCYATYTKYENRGFKGGWTIKSLHQLQNLIHSLTRKEIEFKR